MKMVLHLSMHTGMHLLVCPGSQERPGNQPSAHMQGKRARFGGGGPAYCLSLCLVLGPCDWRMGRWEMGTISVFFFPFFFFCLCLQRDIFSNRQLSFTFFSVKEISGGIGRNIYPLISQRDLEATDLQIILSYPGMKPCACHVAGTQEC